MEVRAHLQIVLLTSGELKVTGGGADKVTMIGMLEVAKATMLKAEPESPAIVQAPGAILDRLNGRGQGG